MIAVLLGVAVTSTSCQQLTGVKPPAKPCRSEQTRWIPIRDPNTGAVVDSVLDRTVIDACPRSS